VRGFILAGMTPGRLFTRGFSLLELLVILALIAVLSFFAIRGLSSATQSAGITTAAEMINGALVDARSSAMTQNISVEVRIYSLSTGNGQPAAYDALQLHWLKPDGTTPPVNHVLLLPAGAVIDATTGHSPLIAANSQAATPDSSDSRLNTQTRVFHFLPDGSTDLNPATNWFLTVRAATASDPAHFPSNWASVGIDATTGHAQIYRP
jgi:uncharacterized protein (TIGR02596 family)